MVIIDDYAKDAVKALGEYRLKDTNECVVIDKYVTDEYMGYLYAKKYKDGNPQNNSDENIEFADPREYITFIRPFYESIG